MNLRPMTEAEMAATMLVEAKNELTKCQIIDRISERTKLSGKLTAQAMNMDGMNRHKISGLKETIRHLEAIALEPVHNEATLNEPVIELE